MGTLKKATMKFVAIFLACVVAAQAATSACPSYQYWCAHDFNVLPSQSYYCYSVAFNRNWCTGNYYADCLVEFPTKQGDSCEAEKTTGEEIDAQVKKIEDKLIKARATIKSDLEKELPAFLKNFYAETDPIYIARVKAYEAQLDAALKSATLNFNTAVANAMLRIKSFHDQILLSFRSCLSTRVAR